MVGRYYYWNSTIDQSTICNAIYGSVGNYTGDPYREIAAIEYATQGRQKYTLAYKTSFTANNFYHEIDQGQPFIANVLDLSGEVGDHVYTVIGYGTVSGLSGTRLVMINPYDGVWHEPSYNDFLLGNWDSAGRIYNDAVLFCLIGVIFLFIV